MLILEILGFQVLYSHGQTASNRSYRNGETQSNEANSSTAKPTADVNTSFLEGQRPKGTPASTYSDLWRVSL